MVMIDRAHRIEPTPERAVEPPSRQLSIVKLMPDPHGVAAHIEAKGTRASGRYISRANPKQTQTLRLLKPPAKPGHHNQRQHRDFAKTSQPPKMRLSRRIGAGLYPGLVVVAGSDFAIG
jgi:hypothetical protein